MAHSKAFAGHLAALFCILVWGTTFISTKVLLRAFSPVEILFFSFFAGLRGLWLACPRFLRLRRQATGGAVCLCWPVRRNTVFFVGKHRPHLHLCLKRGRNCGYLAIFCGSAGLLAIAGRAPRVELFSGFCGSHAGHWPYQLQRQHPAAAQSVGDVLAVLAGLSWAGYSILMRKLMAFGYNGLLVTRRCAFMALCSCCQRCPLWILPGSPSGWQIFPTPPTCCFWGWGLRPPVLCGLDIRHTAPGRGKKLRVHLPCAVVTVITAVVLHERITLMAAAGTALTLLGLAISEMRSFSVLKKAEPLRH